MVKKSGVWRMKEQVKVLFVVYKTEWWGCLDSLCRQECSNQNALVYVMPIPRYERELGTTQINYQKVHFTPELLEKELPSGASMADYRTFSLEQGFERIYIHNPYDNTCFVDSVEPKYYSWNLKPYARKLIYVPHLLYIGGIPEEYADSPVYEHVDAVYLADKKAKYSLDVQYDKKVEIVPSGIPEYLARLEEGLKCEKQKERKQQFNPGGQAVHPGGRNAQIRNGEAGSGVQGERKKLLCCLSYYNLYYGSEKLIQKLRDVFEYLKSRKDILLIFYPDEDIRMRFPWLDEPVRKKYAALVAYFQKNRIGIYHEGADLYRSAAEADGILSFGHPADYLFSVQGKYVLRLDNEPRPIPSDEVRCIPSLWAMTAVEEEDGIELWFVPDRTRLICRMVMQGDIADKDKRQFQNKKSKKQTEWPQVEIVAEVPDDDIRVLNYVNVTKIGRCLYLSPYNSKSIWKYDLDSHCFSGQSLPDLSADFCASVSISYGKYLYLIPRMYPGIIKYDVETDDIEVIDGWVEELERYVLPECRKESYFLWAVKQEKNMLYMASAKCDVWMTFDMDSDTWQMKSMNLPKREFADMVKDKERVWLFPYCGDEVILWNCITNKSQVIYRAKTKETKYQPYEFACDLGDTIAAFSKHAENVLLIPLDASGEQESIEITSRVPCREQDYLSEYQRSFKVGYQFVKKLKDGRILAYEYYDGAFFLLNRKLQIEKKIYCRLPLDAISRQQNITWENVQSKDGFSGNLNESYFLPAMIDFFVEHGQKDREDIKEYYAERLGSGENESIS